MLPVAQIEALGIYPTLRWLVAYHIKRKNSHLNWPQGLRMSRKGDASSERELTESGMKPKFLYGLLRVLRIPTEREQDRERENSLNEVVSVR